MDTDVPLLLLQVQFSAAALALLLVGSVFAVLDGLMAAAAVSGIYRRELSRPQGWRTVIGAATSKLISVLCLVFAIHEAYDQALLPVLQQSGVGGEFMLLLTVFGVSLLLAVVAASVFAAGFLLLDKLARPARRVVDSGVRVAEWLTIWLPAKREPGGGVDEPEFEITMASGEEVDPEEREYIENILEMGETTVREVMKPRPDVFALDADWPAERILAEVAQSRYSRFPVYEQSVDHIVGVLHLRDLFEYLARSDNNLAGFELRNLLAEPHFVPESKKVDDALRELQRFKWHLAVVLDEYGGTAGIVTIEDLLEEIVGEIQDEYDDEAKLVHQREDGSWVVTANLPLDDLNELLSTELDAEDVDTVGGYIVNALGRIPLPQDVMEEHGLRFTVLSVERKRIGRIRIERVEATAAA